MGKSKHGKRRCDYSSSESSEAGSVEERPSKKARRSRKRHHSSSDDESDSASSTTSEGTRSSTSTSSSSSSSEPRRKRRRGSYHHKRSRKHWDSKGKVKRKEREKKRHRKKGDVRRRHKKGEKDTSGQPEKRSAGMEVEVPVAQQVAQVEKRPAAVEMPVAQQVAQVEKRPAAVEMPVAQQVAQVEKRPAAVEVPAAQQVAQVEKLHASGPPFPYAPSAGLRVPKQEFIKQYIQPAIDERMRKTNEKKKHTASATAARPKAMQMSVISTPFPFVTTVAIPTSASFSFSAEPPEVPETHVAQERSSAGWGEVAMHGESTLNTSHRAATGEAGTCTAPIPYAQMVDGGSGQEKSSVSGGESVSEYLCREFNVRVSDLWSVFHNQLGKVKELLIGKQVRGDPLHYPRGGVSFVVDDVTGAPPDRLSAYQTPGPGPYTVTAHFQRRGIKLKHAATWPCLVHRGGRVSSKRRANQSKDHVSYYPIEVLQFDVAGGEIGTNDEEGMEM